MKSKPLCRNGYSGGILFLFILAFNLSSYAGVNPTPIYESHNYRMVFTEQALEFVGEGFTEVTPQMVDQKIGAAYEQLFINGSATNERIVFDAVGGPAGLKFVKDIGSDDIRSEGMSYGMMIAVMMDDQAMFNALWGFVRNYMYHPNGTHYSWSLQDATGYPVSSENPGGDFHYGEGPAPDAEEFFAMALIFAHYRWGSAGGQAIADYQYWATHTLGLLRSNTLWNGSMVRFTPSAGFTDPSYHLPAFYELFQNWDDGISDNFWQNAANTSRSYFVNAADETTGLFPEYSEQNGDPHFESYNELSSHSAFDSYRVIQNMAMDHAWISKDNRMSTLVRGVMDFYNELSDPDVTPTFWDFQYGAVYGLQVGTTGDEFYRTTTPNPNSFPANANPWPDRADSPVLGLAAMNAVGALAIDDEHVKYFVRHLWDQDPPVGGGRYYDGLLYLFGYLHLAGYYRMYFEAEGTTLDLSMDTGRVTNQGTPIIHWRDPAYFTGAGCPQGENIVSYQWEMDFHTAGYPSIGPEPLTLLENGRWLGSIDPVFESHDDFTIYVTRVCDGASGTREDQISGFVDPSGYVKDTFGNGVSGAKVVLWQTNTSDINSTLIQVPQDSTQMAVYNRNNPDYTSTTGHFGWDVSPNHWYKVVASAAGCVNPDDHSDYEVETPLMFVGPEITDLDLRLYCPYQGKLSVKVETYMDWGYGYCAQVDLHNSNSWALDWLTSFDTEGEVYIFWGADYNQSDRKVTIQGLESNNELGPNEGLSINFCATRNPEYDISVRARGTSGSEMVRLTVGGQTIAQWTLSSNFTTRTYSTELSGGINIEYVNDYGYYRDVVVDYVEIGGIRHQAETQSQYSGSASGSGNCSNGQNDGWIHCNGYIGFSAFK